MIQKVKRRNMMGINSRQYRSPSWSYRKRDVIPSVEAVIGWIKLKQQGTTHDDTG